MLNVTHRVKIEKDLSLNDILNVTRLVGLQDNLVEKDGKQGQSCLSSKFQMTIVLSKKTWGKWPIASSRSGIG